ncbi:MAG: hypothetical protein R3249_07930, partial [Nitriliruptorales bacterium]|nr:hypothetical protein [Nitriliruptorales bacterium]
GKQIRQVASVLVSLDEAVIDGAVEAAVSSEIWEPLVHAGVAAEHLPPDVRERLAAIIERHGDGLAARFDEAASRLGHDGLRQRLLG